MGIFINAVFLLLFVWLVVLLQKLYLYSYVQLQQNSLYRVVHNTKLGGILGFSAPSIILKKVGLMQITI